MIELPPSGLVTLLTGDAGALVLAILFLWQFIQGRLFSYKSVKAERDQAHEMLAAAISRGDEWKSLYQAEAASHEKTRSALAQAAERADSQAELVRVTARMMEQVQQTLPNPPRQALGSGS